MSLNLINLNASNRLSVLGRPGTGKTTLLKALISAFAEIAFLVENWEPYHIIILDTKKDNDFDGMGKKFRRLKDLPKLWQHEPILIFEPIEEEMTEEYYDGFIKFLRLTKEPFLLIIDELSSLLKNGRAPQQYELLMKQGRGKKQVAWCGIQNPVYIPHDFLSNTDHIFVFDLLMKGDREKLKGIMGDKIMEPPLDEHGFYYFSTRGKLLHYFSNNPLVDFGVSSDIFKQIRNADPRKEGEKMNTKFIMALLFLGLAMAFIIPVWKTVVKAAAGKVTALEPVAAFVDKA